MITSKKITQHTKSIPALYRGYKRRNLQLDALAQSTPTYLVKSKVPLVNQTFTDIESEDTLRQLHNYLFKRYNLLESVIRSRKLHHSHFFAVDNDYGHEKFLAQLQKEKHTAARALERLGRRTADVLYKQQKWFKWVRQCQDNEESRRENESRKVRLEAQLFKRHQKEIEQHQRAMKAREEQKQQEAFLDEAYSHKLSEMTEDEQDEWDPVRDVAEDERSNYIDLIKYFLMLKDSESPQTRPEEEAINANPIVEEPGKGKKVSKKKGRKIKSDANPTEHAAAQAKERRASSIETETQAQLKKRLQEGVKYNHDRGLYLVDTIENPIELKDRSPPMPDDEIETLLKEIAEIKNLLFCRLLLSHAALLPAALRANSIDEFLDDKEVTLEDLRDLCLKIEKPGLQEVRDACADLARRDEEEDNAGNADGDYEDENQSDEDQLESYTDRRERLQPVPKFFKTKREMRLQRQRKRYQKLVGMDDATAFIDFGVIDDGGEYRKKKMRIKIW